MRCSLTRLMTWAAGGDDAAADRGDFDYPGFVHTVLVDNAGPAGMHRENRPRKTAD
jgi:hypothetical protein